MINIKTMTVRFSSEDSGFCRVYYRVLLIDGERPSSATYCCKQGDHAMTAWYTCTSSYLEPESEIFSSIQIVDEKGDVLREASND